MQQKNYVLSHADFIKIIVTGILSLALAFAFGYFFGRYDQIVRQKSQIQPIPDVNCGRLGTH